MKFAEFKDGMLIKAGPVIVTEAEILSSPASSIRSGSTRIPSARPRGAGAG